MFEINPIRGGDCIYYFGDLHQPVKRSHFSIRPTRRESPGLVLFFSTGSNSKWTRSTSTKKWIWRRALDPRTVEPDGAGSDFGFGAKFRGQSNFRATLDGADRAGSDFGFGAEFRGPIHSMNGSRNEWVWNLGSGTWALMKNRNG